MIKEFDSNQSPTPIRDLFNEIQKFLNIVEENGHYFTDSGYYLAGFKSKDDQTIQPYSMVLPKNFNIEQEYVMIVCLHGSGVDEVGFVSFMGKNFGEIGLPFIVVGPRGRGLSDYYIGQTERDVFEMVEQMKSMFKIEKSVIFGFSMGGYGVWRLTFLYPDSFDRAIIGSGMPYNDRTGDPAHDVRELRHNAKNIHYFVMHGTEDRAVPFGPTKEFMEVLENEGFDVTFEVFEGAGHGDYDPSQALMKWMQKHL
jgi:predicted esterase